MTDLDLAKLADRDDVKSIVCETCGHGLHRRDGGALNPKTVVNFYRHHLQHQVTVTSVDVVKEEEETTPVRDKTAGVP